MGRGEAEHIPAERNERSECSEAILTAAAACFKGDRNNRRAIKGFTRLCREFRHRRYNSRGFSSFTIKTTGTAGICTKESGFTGNYKGTHIGPVELLFSRSNRKESTRFV